jgi:hypothetical protein
MAKSIGYNISVLKNAKHIIGSSDVDWSYVRPGSYVKILGHPHLYEIAKVNKSIYNADFKTINPKKISVGPECNNYLLNNDLIHIYFQQYELMGLMKILNGGMGYKEDDIVFVEGGNPLVQKHDNTEEKTRFIVRQVDEKGTIKMLAIEHLGIYINKPAKQCFLLNGSGNGAIVEVEYIQQQNRSFIERNIVLIERNDIGKNIYLHLNYPLPDGLSNGIISTPKWDMRLVGEFLGEDMLNVKCEIVTDFTSNLRLPLILPQSIAREPLINKSLVIIDAEIQALKDRLDKLSTTISK